MTKITQKKDENNFRWYSVDGTDYLSVTTALDIISTQEDKDFLLNVTRDKYNDIMANTAEIGTKIHDAVEYAYKNSILSPKDCEHISKDALPALAIYQDFVESKGIKHIQHEVPVYSKRYGYAGTLDGIIEINGKKYIYDLKTGRFHYKHGFQVQAYRRAAIEMGICDESVGTCLIYCHRSGERPIAFYSHKQHDFLFEQFLACLWLHQGLYPKEWGKLKGSPYQWQNPNREYFGLEFGARPEPEDFEPSHYEKFGIEQNEKMD